MAGLIWRYTGGILDPNVDVSRIVGSRGGSPTIFELITGFQNLFDHVNNIESYNGDTEYRALDLYADGVDIEELYLYLSQVTSSPDSSLEIAHEAKLDGVYSPIAKTSSEGAAPEMYSGQGIVDTKGFNYDNQSGDELIQGDPVVWDTGSGIVYYNDTTNDYLAIELVSGSYPTDDDTIVKDYYRSSSTSSTTTEATQDSVDVDGETEWFSRGFASRVIGVSELPLPDLQVGEAHRIWFKRVITPGASNENNDNAIVQTRCLSTVSTTTTTTVT